MSLLVQANGMRHSPDTGTNGAGFNFLVPVNEKQILHNRHCRYNIPTKHAAQIHFLFSFTSSSSLITANLQLTEHLQFSYVSAY